MTNIGELEIGFKLNEGSLRQAKNKITSELEQAGNEWGKALADGINKQTGLLSKLTSQFWSLKSMILGTFAVGGITSMIKGIFNLTGQAESARKSFITLTGSVELADQQLEKINQFAKKTPFNKMGIIQASQQMMGMGFSAKQTLPILNSVGNAVSAMGGNQDQLNGVILALGQMQTKGKVATQELLQIAERGLPVFEILWQKLNLTKEQLGDIGNQGISSAQAIPALLEGLNERFAGSMESQSTSLLGRRSNIVDTFQQKVVELGNVLYPIFSTVLSLIGALIEPLFAVATLVGQGLSLAFQGLGIIANGVLQGIGITLNWLKDNRVAVTKFIVATFLSALVIMKRQAIIDRVNGAMLGMVNSLKNFYAWIVRVKNFNLVAWIKWVSVSTREATKQIYTQTIAWVKNTAGTLRQAVANGVTSLSFKAVGGSIIDVAKKLLFLGLKFFLIAGIVVAVVTAIYANWDKLKQKLKPIFEFIAKVGQKAPEIIAKGWNMLVDIVVGAYQSILGATQSLVNWLKKFNIDIGGSGIDQAIIDAENFRQKMQITTEDVSSAFNAMGDMVGDTFDAVKTAFTGAGDGMDLLGGSTLSVGDNFTDMGDKAEKGSKKTKKGVDEAKKALDKAEEKADAFAKKVDKLQDVTEKYAEKSKEFYDGITNSLREVDTQIQDAIKSYDELIAKIKEEGEAKAKSNAQDFFSKQALDQVQLEKDLAGIQAKIDAEKKLAETKLASATDVDDIKKYTIQTGELDKQKSLLEEINKLQNEARGFTKDTTKETADQNIARQAVLNQMLDELENAESTSDATKTQLELTRERYNLLQQIAEIQKNINSEEAKASGVDIAGIQQGARQKGASSTQGAELIDYQQKQAQNTKEVQDKIDDETKKFEAEKARLEKTKEIYKIFNDARLKDTKELNALLEEENLRASTVEEQQLILKLSNERTEINNLFNERKKLELELLNTKSEMVQTATDLMLQQGAKTREDVQKTIDKINEAIARMNALRAGGGSSGSSVAGARMNGGNVDAGKTYLVGEDWPELATFGHNATIIPNIKTLVREALSKGVSPDKLANKDGTVTQKTVDNSMKIDQVVVQNGTDWDSWVEREKWRRK